MRFVAAILFFLMTLSQSVLASQSDEWLKEQEYQEGLKAGNKLESYKKYDFSSLLVPRSQFLGYIGENYKRLYIQFNSVVKDSAKPLLYRVVGSSWALDGSRTEFRGYVELISAREYKPLPSGMDVCEYGIKDMASGFVLGKYRFVEPANKRHSGVYEGYMQLYWLLDSNGEIQYDDTGNCADSYNQNQYVGTWKSYNKSLTKRANWGEYRIPYSGDLDCGAGDFGVCDKKYIKLGWEVKSGCEEQR